MSNLKQTDISKAQKSDLVQALGTTVMGSMLAKQCIIKELQDQLRQDQTKGDGIAIPTFQYFLTNMVPEMRSQLTDVYKKTMSYVGAGDFGDYTSVSDEVQAAQGSLFDGLMFVYDAVKDTYCLATMNPELIERLGSKLPSWKAVLKDNLEGYVRAYRIDVSFSSVENDLSYKAVQARDFLIDEAKPDFDETKRFTLIPYHFVEQLIEVVATKLNQGFVIHVAQTVGGMKKLRFITKNQEVLAKYCDDPSAVVTDARYFVDLGFFYAPSVGASSLTAMVTNIRVFDIDGMSLLNDTTAIDKAGITKPQFPIRDLLGEGLVCGEMARFAASGDNKFDEVCESLSYSSKLFKDRDKVSVASIAKYLHTVPSTSKEKAYALCKVKGKLNDLEKYFSNMVSRPLTPEDDIKKLLKNGVVRVVVQKEKDCRLSSIFCTNSSEVLTKVYGENYMKKYEGFSSCFYRFFNWLMKEGDITDEQVKLHLIESGLTYEDGTVAKIVKLIKEKSDMEELEDSLKGYLAARMGVDVKHSTASSNAQTSNIMVRTLTAFLDYDNKPYDYYRYIDPAKIVRGTVFELK